MLRILTLHKASYVWILGFISGFNLLLSGSTLNFWLATNKIDKSILGLFSIVSLPYAINFLWAPALDKFIKSCKGKISSILAIYFFLGLSLLTISYINPITDLYLLAINALFISFFSATGDVALGGIRSELLEGKEHGPAGGVYNFGYRIGMTISGSFAIYISNFLSWKSIYQLSFFSLAILSVLLCYFIKYYDKKQIHNSRVIYQENKNILTLFKHLGGNKILIIILLFLIIYRLSDNLIGQMLNVFLLELGFNSFDIATTGKLWGTIGTIIGSFIASIVMARISVGKSLLYFGLLHSFAHLFLILQYIVGKNYILFFCTTTVESITCGMSMSAYMALITGLCKGKYKATQYSLLTSMMGLSRALFPAISGILVNVYGWYIFFIITTILTIPSLFLIPYFSKIIDKD